MKLLWNIPSLGLWSTIDRIAVVNNALSKASSVSVLGMYCGFSHSRVESAYLLGAICGVASLAVLGIWILLGMYLLWELARNPDTSVDWIILEVAAYVAGMNVAIALSVPLLALSVPLGFLLVVVQAWSLVRERWMHKSIFDTSSAADTLTINVVKAIGGEHLCTVEADPSWIVARLKIAIRSDLGVPSQLQRLVCRNRPMLDSDHLRDHLAISRAGYFLRIFGGHREPRVLEVGLMQYQSLPECTPRASESLVDLVDHVDGILSVEGGDEVGVAGTFPAPRCTLPTRPIGCAQQAVDLTCRASSVRSLSTTTSQRTRMRQTYPTPFLSSSRVAKFDCGTSGPSSLCRESTISDSR